MTTTIPVQLDIAPLSGTIGAEIRGLDLPPLDPETVAAIRQALLDCKVIFFPGPAPAPEEHKDFAARFGEPTVAHPVIPGLEDHPEVFEIDYTKARELCGGYGDISTTSRGATGTPTSPSSSARRSAPSSTPSSSRRPAATRCWPTPRPPTRASGPSRQLVDR